MKIESPAVIMRRYIANLKVDSAVVDRNDTVLSVDHKHKQTWIEKPMIKVFLSCVGVADKHRTILCSAGKIFSHYDDAMYHARGLSIMCKDIPIQDEVHNN